MKFLDYLLQEQEYLTEVQMYGQRHFIKRNKSLVKAFKNKEKFDFVNVWTELKDVLWRKQGKRCCLCEKELNDIYAIDVEHYRPKGHYWWLAYNYLNYYLACAECNRQYKRVQFPLLDETKKVDYTTRSSIQNEIPLLLNPLFDNPLDYFELHFRSSSNNKNILVLQVKSDLQKNTVEYKKAHKTLEVLNLDLKRFSETRHDLFRKFSDRLISIAYHRKTLRQKDFIKYVKEQKEDVSKRELFSLGLMKMIFKGQFKLDKYTSYTHFKKY